MNGLKCCALALALAAPAMSLAQTAPPPPTAASNEPAADAARMAAATDVAARLFPDGIYQRMFSGTFDQMMAGMMDMVLAEPADRFIKAAGVQVEPGDPAMQRSLREIVAIGDPAFDERMKLSMGVMTRFMADLGTRMEPGIRAGLARAYAGQFTAAQLQEIGAFLATPTGAAYADQSLVIMMDPAVMQEMMAMMPAVMEQMPRIVAEMEAATKHLPPPRKPEELSAADRARIKALASRRSD